MEENYEIIQHFSTDTSKYSIGHVVGEKQQNKIHVSFLINVMLITTLKKFFNWDNMNLGVLN